MPRTAPAGPYTSIKACLETRPTREIPASDLDERMAPPHSHDVYAALHPYRIPAVRHRDDDPQFFRIRRRCGGIEPACVDQQGHVDHAAADLLPAADRAHSRCRSRNSPNV